MERPRNEESGLVGTVKEVSVAEHMCGASWWGEDNQGRGRMEKKQGPKHIGECRLYSKHHGNPLKNFWPV